MTDVVGWAELTNGTIVESAYIMYNSAFLGNFLLVVFVTLQLTLLMKTHNAGLSFGIGMIFFAMFYLFLSPLSITIMTTVLVLELGATLYRSFFVN